MSRLAAAADRIGRTQFLDVPARAIQRVARKTNDQPTLDAVLGGDWLGHPLHPLAAQLPLGAWSSAVLLDLVDGEGNAGAVDLLTLAGILTALPAAASGAHDWALATGPGRRVGLVHAATVDTALVLFVSALVARRRGDRKKGRRLALAGFGTVVAGGYLGGHLAYALGVGERR